MWDERKPGGSRALSRYGCLAQAYGDLLVASMCLTMGSQLAGEKRRQKELFEVRWSWRSLSLYMYVSLPLHVYTFICMCVCMNVYVCMYVCIYVCMFLCCAYLLSLVCSFNCLSVVCWFFTHCFMRRCAEMKGEAEESSKDSKRVEERRMWREGEREREEVWSRWRSQPNHWFGDVNRRRNSSFEDRPRWSSFSFFNFF